MQADQQPEVRPAAPALEMRQVRKHYRVPGGVVQSVAGVDLTVARGEIVALVGESGSGKSTIGRMAVALIPPTSGEVYVHGQQVSAMSRRSLRPLRKGFNIVFQDPGSSINPRTTVGKAIAEPLRTHRVVPEDQVADEVARLLDLVGLPQHVTDRHPHELSGGQRQRVSFARALAARPGLLVADEPTSALDVSVRASVLNVLVDLQRDLGFACLFISHDLSSVEYLANRVAVMYLGRIVELADTDDLFASPLHPYTQALLSAAPVPDPVTQRERERIVLSGSLPSPIDPPPGCTFHPRCPLAQEVCRTTVPALREVGPSRRQVACHLVSDEGVGPQVLGHAGRAATADAG